MNGRPFTPPNDPPPYPTRSWVPLTYEAQHFCNGDSTGTSIAAGALMDEVKARYAIAETGQVAIRIHNAQVWAMSSGPDFPKPGLEADFYELASQGSSAIARRRTRDDGTLQRPAVAGFEYPSVDQKEICTDAEKSKLVVAATGTKKGTTLVIRVFLTFYSF